METWELATIIVVPVVVLALLTAAIGFLCMKHYQSKKIHNGTATNGDTANGVVESQRLPSSLDVEAQRRTSLPDVESHGLTSSLHVESHRLTCSLDIESQERTSSLNVESQRRTSSLNDESQRKTSSFDVESQGETSSNDRTVTRSLIDNVSIANENKVPHNYGIEIQSGKDLRQYIIEETLRRTFITENQKRRDNLPPAVETLEKTVHQNFGSGITTGREIFSLASIISEMQKLNVSNKSTNAQNQKQVHTTHTTAVKQGTRYTEQFTREPKIDFDTLTGYAKLDLHYYTKKEAMTVFKTFLQDSIAGYINSNYRKKMRFILVITGRGLHSRGGIPVIKIAVEDYLNKHDYTYNWSNPGMARIDLLPFRDSFLDY